MSQKSSCQKSSLWVTTTLWKAHLIFFLTSKPENHGYTCTWWSVLRLWPSTGWRRFLHTINDTVRELQNITPESGCICSLILIPLLFPPTKWSKTSKGAHKAPALHMTDDKILCTMQNKLFHFICRVNSTSECKQFHWTRWFWLSQNTRNWYNKTQDTRNSKGNTTLWHAAGNDSAFCLSQWFCWQSNLTLCSCL